MKQRILKFSVKNQRITAEDISVVADSRNYLSAFFAFDSTWEGVEKTAVFSHGEETYNMLLEGDMCRIPAEVIKPGFFYVSVFGGDLITADRIRIEVTPSGLLEGVSPPVPTPDIYNQLVETVASEAADAAASAEISVTASQMAQDFTAENAAYAETVADGVKQVLASEAVATNAMVECGRLAEEANTAAIMSLSASESAQENAGMAQNFSIAAEEAAARAEDAAERRWETVLDVKLNAEQAGVGMLLLQISNADAVATASRIRFFIELPQAEALAANKMWLSVSLVDANITKYEKSIIAGYNVAGGAGETYYATANIDISDYSSGAYGRSFHSIFQLPNPWYIACANSLANVRQITGGYPAQLIKENPPYLRITLTKGYTFLAGTRVFMEVCK